MFSFVLRVDYFAVSLAVSRYARTRHDTSISVAQSLPVMFALAHHAGVVCIRVFSLITLPLTMVPLGYRMGVEPALTR